MLTILVLAACIWQFGLKRTLIFTLGLFLICYIADSEQTMRVAAHQGAQVKSTMTPVARFIFSLLGSNALGY